MIQIVKDKEYTEWIAELSHRYRQSQIKASVRVNNEMLRFYWSVGKDIAERQYDNKYGSHFYENLSNDLTKVVGNKRGLAPTSLRYTKYFYSLYSPPLHFTLYPCLYTLHTPPYTIKSPKLAILFAQFKIIHYLCSRNKKY